ncbi:VWA domain containing CoxE-like protein [Thermosporothrix hazakensis]|jgi:Mg-chelatase subunit ChlD|uniref:VWA domain containing CoxE-like protein n=1 Tax=Thermosporothrix hazakensis TaxID=644383 RepID=A0A326UBC9_THEHA|nr:VWA domain-containing protein [Thermosporothrix hazakensis]PZW22376.1 VWA domain containing CoxE-like protein [Thermosporothrix hazakensis]GCE49129.1 VWA domain-containing protein [Thermosporothrix hazakensis]
MTGNRVEPQEQERLRRWRLILGKAAEQGLGIRVSGNGAGTDEGEDEGSFTLSDVDQGMDDVLAALYDADKQSGRRGGLGASSPRIARWLGDIRTYFPTSTVRLMQQDALDRLNLTEMLLQPEMLEQVEPDIHMVTTLLTLNKAIPEETKETARMVVRKVVEDLERKLANPLMQAVRGSLNRATHTRRPRANEIDWDRTIRANLKNYLPEKKTIIAEQLIGYGHKRSSLRDIVLCVDQSGSMGTSVVYSGVFGAVLATLRAVSTKMVVFDTSVVDLTEDLQDPVDLLFGTQLGGGTDINRALGYCQQIITKPNQTILVLITDLYEGGNERSMLQRAAELVASGVQVICLLALNDTGAPIYDHRNAARLAGMGIPTFACTPDLFPDLMAAAIMKQDLNLWASQNDIVTARGDANDR